MHFIADSLVPKGDYQLNYVQYGSGITKLNGKVLQHGWSYRVPHISTLSYSSDSGLGYSSYQRRGMACNVPNASLPMSQTLILSDAKTEGFPNNPPLIPDVSDLYVYYKPNYPCDSTWLYPTNKWDTSFSCNVKLYVKSDPDYPDRWFWIAGEFERIEYAQQITGEDNAAILVNAVQHIRAQDTLRHTGNYDTTKLSEWYITLHAIVPPLRFSVGSSNPLDTIQSNKTKYGTLFETVITDSICHLPDVNGSMPTGHPVVPVGFIRGGAKQSNALTTANPTSLVSETKEGLVWNGIVPAKWIQRSPEGKILSEGNANPGQSINYSKISLRSFLEIHTHHGVLIRKLFQ